MRDFDVRQDQKDPEVMEGKLRRRLSLTTDVGDSFSGSAAEAAGLGVGFWLDREPRYSSSVHVVIATFQRNAADVALRVSGLRRSRGPTGEHL